MQVWMTFLYAEEHFSVLFSFFPLDKEFGYQNVFFINILNGVGAGLLCTPLRSAFRYALCYVSSTDILNNKTGYFSQVACCTAKTLQMAGSDH